MTSSVVFNIIELVFLGAVCVISVIEHREQSAKRRRRDAAIAICERLSAEGRGLGGATIEQLETIKAVLEENAER
jgi:hypothetical protein